MAREGSGSVSAEAWEDAGCGWFESSWDLKQGLSVIERMDAQAELDAWMAQMMAPASDGRQLDLA